ncbi:MAG: hypothetical protein ISS16_02595 [Ignavibacteria bacterium]|nr:hypothetical protein [Ignavibacteria bacterium]
MKALRILFLLLLLLYCWDQVECQVDSVSRLEFEDRIRIAEVFNISEKYGNSIWQGLDTIPFVVLLVTNDNEFLIRHPNPTEDFKLLEYDSLLQSNIYVRDRQFSNNILATFPAVNGVNTVVVGQSENTNRSSTAWIITLIHEHFHQLQMSKPDYFPGVEELDLAGDDKSGMWMLNYPFPYDDEEISNPYQILTEMARNTLMANKEEDFNENLLAFLEEKEKFKNMLDDKDYRYFSFQLWQEGIARYTELLTAKLLSKSYEPCNDFKMLPDYIDFDSYYKQCYDKNLRRLETQALNFDKRTCFYTLGAAEGLILDRVNPEWRDRYFDEMFFIEKYYSLP